MPAAFSRSLRYQSICTMPYIGTAQYWSSSRYAALAGSLKVCALSSSSTSAVTGRTEPIGRT